MGTLARRRSRLVKDRALLCRYFKLLIIPFMKFCFSFHIPFAYFGNRLLLINSSIQGNYSVSKSVTRKYVSKVMLYRLFLNIFQCKLVLQIQGFFCLLMKGNLIARDSQRWLFGGNWLSQGSLMAMMESTWFKCLL